MSAGEAGRFVVAGGGIGGLATALGLARRGVHSLVLERAKALGEIGAGVQLGPNAFHCFDALGIGDAARATAVYIDSLRLMDALTAREIARMPLDAPFRARFGNPYAVAHRGDLHGVLLRACREHPLVELRPATAVTGYSQDAAGVDAVCGEDAFRGAALIGADGLWSAVRRQVVGDGAPRVSGHTTYRSVIAAAEMPDDLRWNAATLWAGPKLHVVHYPLSGGKTFNLVVTRHDDAPEPVAGKPVADAKVLDAFREAHPRVRRVIERGRDWRLWVLCDRDPVSRWVDGRVALLGDAAHPMLQYFAQGACMALEDAVCLADCVAASPGDIAAALARYRDRRLLRTTRVQLQSRAIGEHIYHPAGPHAALRDAMLGAKSPQQMYDTVAWLYGGTGLADPSQSAGTS